MRFGKKEKFEDSLHEIGMKSNLSVIERILLITRKKTSKRKLHPLGMHKYIETNNT